MPDKVHKSYKDIGDIPPEFEDELLLERVVELYGKFKSKKQIRETLSEELGYKELISAVVISILISRAKAKIREDYGIDPKDYQGRFQNFLEQMMGGKAMNKDRLSAAKMWAQCMGVADPLPSTGEKELQELDLEDLD